VNVHDTLRDLVADEPPFVLRPDEEMAAGRRRRRGRAVTVVGTAAVAASVAVGTLVLAAPGTAPATVGFAGTPTAAANADSGELDNPYYAVARAHTPDGWTISKAKVDGDGFWADVDDGVHGPGRLGMFRSNGQLQLHPCSDAEFVARATSCTETMLDADTRLIVRTVSHTDPINDIQVVIVHANGYGVNVSDDNAVLPDVPDGLIVATPEQKRALGRGTVGSAEPLYSTDQLVAMAEQLDATTG
jgi:hypothetical protein